MLLKTFPIQFRSLLRNAGLIALSAFAVFSTLPAIAAPIALSSFLASPVEGTWRTEKGTELTVAPCDAGFCGTLSWIVVPPEYSAICQQDKAAFGTAMVDLKNADPALRTRPMLGLQILTLKPTDDPLAFTVHIYNAEDGKDYDGSVWIMNNNETLRMGGGCLGNMCAVTQDWPKVPARDVSPDFTCTAP